MWICRSVLPAVDVIETQDAFVVQVDLRGIEPKNVDVSVAGNVLTLKGRRKPVEPRGEVTIGSAKRRGPGGSPSKRAVASRRAAGSS